MTGCNGGFGSGSCGFGCGVGAATVSDSGAGCDVAQAASCSANAMMTNRNTLVTEANSHYVNLGRAQSTSGYVEEIELIDWTYVDSIVVTVIDSGTLYA